jgi:hypothetical protein
MVIRFIYRFPDVGKTLEYNNIKKYFYLKILQIAIKDFSTLQKSSP